ncbi:hypothetical protein EKE94_07715 [Mesobaculum littorinae]|uniref:Uncharacterized protein n=1 Tax=Mesobaculum littorinae TaxID=2486419 RepID=A0A438AJC0_9RHOB|nr:hypothetical protein [Mesobaculum littorinae]RVV98778.1 hypothetical protein EKE94_07715 [Mesobaculum littorinae]
MRFLGRLFARTTILVTFVVVLIASNIAVLTVDAVYDLGRRRLWAATRSISDAPAPPKLTEMRTQAARSKERAVQLEAANGKLEARVGRLEGEARDLDRQRRQLIARVDNLEGDIGRANARAARLTEESAAGSAKFRCRARDLNARIAGRTSRSITANVSSMSVEALPWVGGAAVLGVTFLEVRDACATLSETRQLAALLDGTPVEDVPACGYSASEFKDLLLGTPDRQRCEDLNRDIPEDLRLPCTQISLPGETAAPAEEAGRIDLSLPGE